MQYGSDFCSVPSFSSAMIMVPALCSATTKVPAPHLHNTLSVEAFNLSLSRWSTSWNATTLTQQMDENREAKWGHALRKTFISFS
ncbi:hypothetical protein CR513_50483, partial [Mucuna pruriens]